VNEEMNEKIADETDEIHLEVDSKDEEIEMMVSHSLFIFPDSTFVKYVGITEHLSCLLIP